MRLRSRSSYRSCFNPENGLGSLFAASWPSFIRALTRKTDAGRGRRHAIHRKGRIRTAAVIDVETVGLDADHPIIDLAIQRIAFDERGRIVRLGKLRQWFEDPGMPIPAQISRLTGINDTDVAGQRIDAIQAARQRCPAIRDLTLRPLTAQ